MRVPLTEIVRDAINEHMPHIDAWVRKMNDHLDQLDFLEAVIDCCEARLNDLADAEPKP